MRIWRESVLWYLRRGLKEAGEVQRGMMEKRVEREVERSKSALYKAKNIPGREALVREIVGGEEWRGGGGGGGVTNGGARKGGMGAVELEAEERRNTEMQLSPEQLQLFERENEDLMKRYEGQLDQIRYFYPVFSSLFPLSFSHLTFFPGLWASSYLVLSLADYCDWNYRTAEKSLMDIAEMQSQLIQQLDVQAESIQQMQVDSLNTAENVGGGNKQLKKAAERKSTARLVFWATCGLCSFLVAWDLVF